MNPSLRAVFNTLQASMQEHILPDLRTPYARAQAQHVLALLEWLARGLDEPLQSLRQGNAGVRAALEAVRAELERLSADEDASGRSWRAPHAVLHDALAAPVDDTPEGRREERQRLAETLDTVVAAAGAPSGAPPWPSLVQAIGALVGAEAPLGLPPFPPRRVE